MQNFNCEFLHRLKQVRQTGPRQFIAYCPVPGHEDHTPSLSVKLTDDDVVLVHCHAGCSTRAVVESVGLRLQDLFATNRLSEERRKEYQFKRLQAAYNHEKTVLLIARADLKRGQPLSDVDQQRVNLALRRIQQYACLFEETA
ncbi:MAG: hypothetical protein ABW086_08620 [Sedimenticola sp.]